MTCLRPKLLLIVVVVVVAEEVVLVGDNGLLARLRVRGETEDHGQLAPPNVCVAALHWSSKQILPSH